jgi:hypothetical protein
MVHRYSVSLYDEEIYQDDDGTFVYYFDYADLEQRFNALSAKFTVMVEENALLRKRLERFEIFAQFILEECDDWGMAYDAAKKCMALKEPPESNGK